MGVVTSTITPPTQYGHFFQTYVPLPHNLVIFQAESTLGPDPPPIMPTWPDLGSESAHFVKFWPKLNSDNAPFAQFSFKFGLESALFVWCGYLIVSTLLHVVPNPLSIVPTLFNFGQNSFPIRPTLFEIGPIPLRRTSTSHMLAHICFLKWKVSRDSANFDDRAYIYFSFCPNHLRIVKDTRR